MGYGFREPGSKTPRICSDTKSLPILGSKPLHVMSCSVEAGLDVRGNQNKIVIIIKMPVQPYYRQDLGDVDMAYSVGSSFVWTMVPSPKYKLQVTRAMKGHSSDFVNKIQKQYTDTDMRHLSNEHHTHLDLCKTKSCKLCRMHGEVYA